MPMFRGARCSINGGSKSTHHHEHKWPLHSGGIADASSQVDDLLSIDKGSVGMGMAIG
jgi:hypothetical protein